MRMLQPLLASLKNATLRPAKKQLGWGDSYLLMKLSDQYYQVFQSQRPEKETYKWGCQPSNASRTLVPLQDIYKTAK